MAKIKTTFQNIHYNRQKANICLFGVLRLVEFFYLGIINFKNFLYEKNILSEEKTNANVIWIGNLTTGGTGKTPVVNSLANKISKNENVAIISRGYKAKLNNKNPNIIKDLDGIKFKDGNVCGDEPYQTAKKTNKNVVVITCVNRKKAIDEAISKGCRTVILDDGFSNRKVKKDRTSIVIDSKMRFGNNHLLPLGPLREPVGELKRADSVILVNKGDENIDDALNWIKKIFNKKISICNMVPKRIYNLSTKADIITSKKEKAIAFCAIGQSGQFFDFAKKFYDIKKEIPFDDHHKYSKNDIKTLIKEAKQLNCTVFLTTQKDEAKLKGLLDETKGFSFNVLELDIEIKELN